jgi:hypothetical protein
MRLFIAAALAAAVLPASAQAAITIDITQVGTSVVLAGAGSFDLTGLKLYGTGYAGGATINPASGAVSVGTSSNFSIFTGVTGPVLGYRQSVQTASSSTGDRFGVTQYLGGIFLPANYQSGAALSGTSTYLNTTIANLGLTAGTYIFRSANDSLTLNIGAVSAVPEPATWALMLLGFGGVGVAMRRRSKTRVAVKFA